MPIIPSVLTVSALQEYVRAMEVERGFSRETVVEKCLLLGEEVGELFKAVRKDQGVPTEVGVLLKSVDEELADVMIMVCSLANHKGVDLSEAFRKKEVKNASRVWA